jgi:hypothetical protein
MRTKNGLKTRYKKIPRDEIEKNNKKNIKYTNRANKIEGSSWIRKIKFNKIPKEEIKKKLNFKKLRKPNK